uniref:GTP cyclohydrolase 1 type 2 homolog n=1 Tax=Desulfobacca acetoxidans TaxID=60893 RepID=A0A7V6DR53_9BACT
MRTPVLRPMAATITDILACLDAAYPFSWAISEDRAGLQIGDPRTKVSTMLVALEATPAVAAEAASQQAQLLLTHHPLFFQPAYDIRTDRPAGRLLAALVRAGVAVVSCHTNLDLAPQGLNEHLASELGLEDVEVLAEVRQDAWLKLAVFVPVGYEDQVRAALMDDRVGVIGRYADCSFAGRGQGTYRPLAGARPFRGEAAALCRAEESRLEVLVPESRLAAALARLRAAHPYEEVAYDLYPLANRGLALGFGRVGRWPAGLSFQEVVDRVKAVFAVSGVRIWGRPPAKIFRAAVCGGSGGDLIAPAQAQGAHVYITGEVRHHQAVPGNEEDFAIIEVGHFSSEAVFMPAWAEQVAQLLQQRQLEVQVRLATSQAAPFHLV